MNFQQGSLIKWVNSDNQETVWMITEKENTGVVVHSEGILSIGTLTDLSKQNNLSSFIGTVHMSSEAAK